MAVMTLSLRKAFRVKEYMQSVTAMKLSLRNKSKSMYIDVVLLENVESEAGHGRSTCEWKPTVWGNVAPHCLPPDHSVKKENC